MPEKPEVEIINYQPEHRNNFRDYNRAWIQKYFWLEDIDNRTLDDPEGYILAKGGYIFMAKLNGKIIGTCALIKEEDGVYELAKMAVTDEAKGKGAGLALSLHCIRFARENGFKKLELLSNTKLEPAISLYRKLGFQEVPLPKTEYERANIKMEISF